MEINWYLGFLYRAVLYIIMRMNFLWVNNGNYV